MPTPINEIVKWGTWLYDGSVPAEVRIVRQNHFEDGKWPSKEQASLGPDGCFYILEFSLPGRGLGAPSVSAVSLTSVEEAMARAEAIIKGTIAWNNDKPI